MQSLLISCARYAFISSALYEQSLKLATLPFHQGQCHVSFREMFFTRITGLLLASSLAISGCSALFSSEQMGQPDAGDVNGADANGPDAEEPKPPCEGLSLLKDNFVEGPNESKWWVGTTANTAATVVALSNGVILQTGTDTAARSAALSLLTTRPATGNFVIEIRGLDLADSTPGAFAIALDPTDGGLLVAVSISDGQLSLVVLDSDDQVVALESGAFSVNAPFLLSFSLDGSNARVLTSTDGNFFEEHQSVPFTATVVEPSVVLSVVESDEPTSHSVEIGSIGRPQAWSCSE